MSDAAEKRAFLLERLRAGGARVPAPLLPPDPGERVPLTHGQEQMWLDAKVEPDLPIYNEPVTLHRHGSCDVEALRRAYNLVLCRRDAWRTNIVDTGDDVYQVVREHVDDPLPLLDLTDRPEAEREATALAFATRAARERFDLEHDRLVRALLLRVSPEDHRLHLTLHHLVFDGVGLRVAVAELVELYERIVAGLPVDAGDPPVPYAHYACWERRHLTADGLRPRLDYWRERLQATPPVELPTDRTPHGRGTRAGAQQRFAVPGTTIDGLRRLARDTNTTLFQVLLAAYAVLLHRHTGQDDIVIAALVDGRRHRAVEGLVGFILNPVPVRIDLSGDPTFVELLGRVRDAFLVALANEVPFGELLRDVHPDRAAVAHPLYRVMFSVGPSEPALGDGWDLTELDVEVGAVKCDLHLMLEEQTYGARGRFAYVTDRFDTETGRRLAERWCVLLDAVSSDACDAVSVLPCITAEERTTLDTWNRTEQPFPDVCVHELFEQQARRAPHAVAIVHDERTLTYADLDAAAGLLAARLRALGVGPDERVGVYVERGPEMVVALLAVLKAGGAYVPLGVDLPPSRVAFMIEDAGATLVVCRAERPPDQLPAGVRTVPVDAEGAQDAEDAVDTVGEKVLHRQPQPARPHHLAYVIYTSGSTGQPKGVMIEHGSVVNHLTALQRDYDVGPADTVVQLPSTSFHPSVRDIFGTLTSGGRLVLLDEMEAKDPRRIAEVMQRSEVDCVLSAVPSLLRALLDEWPRVAPGARLRLVLTCGESLRASDARRARELLGAVVANQFGPTETVMACAKHTSDERDPPGGMVPAGRPEANARLYVTDRYGGLAPIGAVGELVVGGPGIARGYLGAPELTAARFGADPHRDDPGARVYRTGDRVRFGHEGCLEFVGRADDQIKVRGHRVEPAEVEATLARCEGVDDAAVVEGTMPDGGARLVGVVVPDREPPVPARDLRAALARVLPTYMVPSAFVTVDRLPLTPNGKVDRVALAGIQAAPDDPVAPEPPRTPTEQVLAAIWTDALGADRMGRLDNFFDAGGDSLLAARLLVTIEQRLGPRLPLSVFFGDGATIAGLAALVDAEAARSAVERRDRLLVVIRQGTVPALFFVYPDDASLLAARHLLSVLDTDCAVFGLRPPLGPRGGGSSVEALGGALLEYVRDQQPRGPYAIAGYSFAGLVAYDIASRLSAEGERIAFLALVDMTTPAIWKREYSPRPWHLIIGGRRKATATRMALNAKRRARDTGGRLGLAPLPLPEEDWLLYLKRARRLGSRYRPDGLRCPLVVFNTASERARAGSATLGWERVHRGPIESVPVPGDHLTLWIEPNVDVLAAAFADRARAALA
jgi:amino acid adenylation domain-containing protein